MIPNIDILSEEITESEYGSETYKIKIVDRTVTPFSMTSRSTQTSNNAKLGSMILGVAILGVESDVEVDTNDSYDRINGYIDGIEAITQAIYLILSTERYAYLIYSWDYGIELIDLYGQPMPYVMSELPRRIEEALTMDDRIETVTDFEFEQNGKKLKTTFTVVTSLGDIETELEVEV